MFDGLLRLNDSPLSPPSPAPLDIVPFLPMLRVEVAEIGVEVLATAVAVNALSARAWLTRNWGPNADYRDHNHPWRAASMADGSPAFKLVEAQSALQDAIARYRDCTGGDGLALARGLIERDYGADVARSALAPLEAVDFDIEAMIYKAGQPEAAVPPVPAQRQAAARATVEWLLSHPDMLDLGPCLEALLAAWVAEGW